MLTFDIYAYHKFPVLVISIYQNLTLNLDNGKLDKASPFNIAYYPPAKDEINMPQRGNFSLTPLSNDAIFKSYTNSRRILSFADGPSFRRGGNIRISFKSASHLNCDKSMY
jgi:hypothetical protein